MTEACLYSDQTEPNGGGYTSGDNNKDISSLGTKL